MARTDDDPARDDPDAGRFLPLTPAAFHVLAALADGDKHGYAVMKEVEERTAGEVVLSAGTLYGLVKRLLQDGLVEEPGRRPRLGEDGRRRTYRLTALGRSVAVLEAERLVRSVALARAKRLVGTEAAR